MSNVWDRVDARDFLRDVERAHAEPYKMVPHKPISMRRLSWVVCQSCGLIFLRNHLTHAAVKLGCNYDRHPSWRSRVSTGGHAG